MRLFFDSFWRAFAYTLHLRVMLLSLLPLVLLMVVAWGWGYFYWEPAVAWVRDGLEGWPLLQKFLGWAAAFGAARVGAAMAPLIVIFAITPLLILLCLLAVSLMMGPALVEMVAQRRFRSLARQHGGSLLASLGWTLGSTLMAGILMLLSMPLWWIPPFIFVLPPLIWGWLTYRVMAFDALAVHASRDERLALLRRHRLWLLLMGVLSGFMGAAPSLVWASGTLFAAAFVVLVPVAIWIYAVVFAFTALWFIHFGLAALQDLRRESDAANVTGAVTGDALGSPDAPKLPPTETSRPDFGVVIVGDEILSGKRADKHLTKVIELLGARGLSLAYADYVGDSPQRITQTLKRAFDSGDIVFSCGGIGATPDDHTRQCAAKALNQALALHPQAEALIRERMQDVAKEQGVPYEPNREDNIHRLNMGVFPQSAQIIPNPYNKIPGFTCVSPGRTLQTGAVHFVPGFPVMAWPMIEWVLDTHYGHLFQKAAWLEKSVIVYGAMEAALTPLMETLEAQHPGVKVFSLPSVDHPEHGRHIELGVKGDPDKVKAAYPAMLAGLHVFGAKLGPELVRS